MKALRFIIYTINYIMKNSILSFLPLFFLLVSCKGDYDYEINVDEQITIGLESSGHDGGYSWCWVRQDHVLDSVSHVFTPFNEDVNGSAGTEHWIFAGAEKGATTIRLEYRKPWNDTVKDAREYTVSVK